ncbi:unnamed protein product [Urochloa humidicola]
MVSTRIVGHEDERCNGFSNLDLNCAPISEVKDLKNVPGGNITGCLRLGVSTESVTRESGSSSPPISRDVLVFDLNADAAMDITPYSEKDAEGVAADVGSIGKNGVGQTSVIGSSSEVGILAIRNGNADDLGYEQWRYRLRESERIDSIKFFSSTLWQCDDLVHQLGTIPSGQQLQTLNNRYMYIGNPGLCGPPLLNNCSTNKTGVDVNQEHEDAIYDKVFFYLSISSGYLIGLWTVFCALLFKKKWRIAYFRHFDQLYDKIYVQATLSKAAIARKFRSEES